MPLKLWLYCVGQRSCDHQRTKGIYKWQEVLTLDDELEGDGATQRAQGHLTLVEAGVRVRQVLEGGHFVCLEEPVILGRTCNHTQRTSEEWIQGRK